MNSHLPNSGLVIRPATLTDIPVIKDVAYQTWPHAYEWLIGREQLEYMLDKFYTVSSLETQMKDKHYFYLALKQYEPVGFTSFSQIETAIYKLQKLYVIPAAHKTGAGQKLLETVQTISRSMGAKKLWLNVNRENPAKGFYERNGFSVLKEEDIDIGAGFYMNDYVMEKIL